MTSIPVTLANCEDEAIHLPGSIQPHGAMAILAATGKVLSYSANFAAITGITPVLDTPLPLDGFDQDTVQMIAEGLAAGGRWENSTETRLHERCFDVIAHRSHECLILEFEEREPAMASFAEFAIGAQRIVRQMQAHDDLSKLMTNVVRELRRITGYDRVMGYRFAPDESGEVIAEARREDLVSYLGQHYPASDIPAQARRLYIQNPIRMIVDVAYQPSPLVVTTDPRDGKAFDLSHSALRSVSPIHCEYLTNMGVHASLSISLVVDGQLWGLFACHHMSPKHLPHPIRMFFQIIAQTSSAIIQRIEAAARSDRLRLAAERRASLMRQALESEDLLDVLSRSGSGLAELLPCDGVAVLFGGRVASVNGDFDGAALAVVEALEAGAELDIHAHEDWQYAEGIQRLPGVLAIQFHRQQRGWVIWFRREEIQTIQWGGKPEKNVKVGPLGPRLTPRGSFEAWEEVIRGRSCSWTAIDRQIASSLRQDLIEHSLHRASEVDHMRQRLIAVLGHDLRNPLQSISMAASMLSPGDARTVELRKHITHSSGRMERLIMQILDMSRLQAGLSITIQPTPTDVSQLVRDIVAESDMAYRGQPIEAQIADGIRANIDPDRYAQVVANLLSNGRHHGLTGQPVCLELFEEAGSVVLNVSNQADPLPESALAGIFTPFRQYSSAQTRNRGGLGIGLYICQAISSAHGGTLSATQDGGRLTFSLRLAASG